MAREVVVPDAVRRKAQAQGAACERWLTELGDVVETLERDWGVAVGATLEGGTATFVAEAVTDDGALAAVKLAMPAEYDGLEGLENEVRTLLAADGRGCVRVLRYDAARGAVLLERLGRQLAELPLAVPTQMTIICAALEQLWTVPVDPRLPSLDVKGRWLVEFIEAAWNDLDRPCSRRVVDCAVTYGERRASAFDPERGVLTHGDAHIWNTLEDVSSPGGFKLVDPDGLVGEREYDLAILMREFTDELLQGDTLRTAKDRARFLANLTGSDERAIWEWGYVERVSTGLLCLKFGDVKNGRDFMRVAESLSDQAP